MLVAQVAFHWSYVGRPQEVAIYKACIKLLQAKPTNYSYVRVLETGKDLVTVHGWAKVRQCCHRRAMVESRDSYSIKGSDFITIVDRMGPSMTHLVMTGVIRLIEPDSD